MAPLVETCCCFLSLRMGTILIGVFYIFLGCQSIAMTARVCPPGSRTELFPKNNEVESGGTNKPTCEELLVESIVGSIFFAIWAVFLICGAALENRFMIIPWVAVQIPFLIGFSIISIMVGALFLADKYLYLWGEIIIWTYSITMLISVYFLIVVISFYQFLRDSERNRQTEPV